MPCSGAGVPGQTGWSRSGLKVATGAYQIPADGSKRRVPSEEHPTGGGGSGGEEWVIFYVHIPLEPTQRDEEARRYLAKLEKSMAPQQITEEARQRALERTRELVYQHRVGHFQVECRISDGDRVIGVGLVELEVLFKGRFSEVGLATSPPI